MNWFQLDPQSIANRAVGLTVPSRRAFISRGIIGFTMVSVAGFLPWGVFGKWFRGRGGELGMYAVCALVFMLLGSLLLHRLILGRGALGRFCKLFTIAFTAYSIAWIVGWMTLRGHAGSLVGLFAGTVVMGWIISAAFEALDQTWKVIAVLFVLNSIGYFVGGAIELWIVKVCECSGGVPLVKPIPLMLAKMQWGVCYGIGLGAGLGIAFWLCQARARMLLTSSTIS